MNEMNNTERFSDRDWERIAAILSGENTGQEADTENNTLSGENEDIGKNWRALSDLHNNNQIDVNSAWEKVEARINEAGAGGSNAAPRRLFIRSTFFKAAAAALIIISLGIPAFYLGKRGYFSKEIAVVTKDDEKKVKIDLPDGSVIYLNRNTKLTYRANYGKSVRNVKLAGEAYFEIAPDKQKPFIVDAGTARIRVTGTSFNVISGNTERAVEVFVNSGQVVVTDNAGAEKLILDPGYIGQVGSDIQEKKLNDNPNYISWKTDLLVYDDQKLEEVFMDLKRTYNMDIVAGDPAILEKRFSTTGPINNENQETIIRVICASFTLSYSKDGNTYHLSTK